MTPVSHAVNARSSRDSARCSATNSRRRRWCARPSPSSAIVARSPADQRTSASRALGGSSRLTEAPRAQRSHSTPPAGQLNAAAGPLPTEVDSGLSVFAPNQARLDDVVLAKNSVATLSDLKGKNVAICCDASPDGVLLTAVLKKAGLSESQLNILRTGASSASLSAMIAGRVDVAFVHSSDVPTAGPGYHVLAVGATILPQYADSFIAATPSWLKANPAMAEAIDLAWLASAKLFNSDETKWVSNAAAYTSNADSTSKYQQSWQELQTIQGWPTAASILTPSIVAFNINIAAQQQALKGDGTRPAAQEMDLTPWQQAWAVFSAHQSAY